MVKFLKNLKNEIQYKNFNIVFGILGRLHSLIQHRGGGKL